MEQLSSMTLVLKPTEPFDKSQRTRCLGPSLQGVLMEHVDSDYAALLHSLPFNPYSQYCYFEDGNLVWKINALTTEATRHILEPLRYVDKVEVRSAHTALEVVKMSQEMVGLKSLVNMINEPGDNKVRVKFLTPTSFKSRGSYVIMPSVRLILQNLLMHYGQVYEDNKEGYSETIEYVDEQVRITSYNLHSSYFGNVGGGNKRVPAFIGTATLSLYGPPMTSGLVRMMLRFGEFAGVGIKTSMGMGGFSVL